MSRVDVYNNNPGGASVKRPKPKKFKNFRFSEATISRLQRFAKRKRCTQTYVMETLIAENCQTRNEEKQNGTR